MGEASTLAEQSVNVVTVNTHAPENGSKLAGNLFLLFC
jgi:hypothetical protein